MKILVIHASAGAGHTKAAEAVAQALEHRTGHHVTFADALDYTSKFYTRSYSEGYAFTITKLPWVWGFFFWLTDIRCLLKTVQAIRRFLYRFNARPLIEYFIKEQFDCIISTHFLPNEVAGYLKKEGTIKSKVISVVTDYDAHSIWLADGVDTYAVACEFTKERLESLGVPEENIRVTGIPVNDKFASYIDTEALKKEMNIKPDKLIILIATGSFGMGPIEDVTKKLKKQHTIAVCGRNKALFEKLKAQNFENTTILPLVDNMHELMAVADVMITKPGGLSITEALVSGLPLIFFSAIPGQEANNITVLKKYGIGIRTKNVSSIVNEINRLSDSPENFSAAKANIQKLARPAAVADIIALIE